MITRDKIFSSALKTFANEANAVARLKETVDKDKFADAVELIATCQGHVITTGCGTSGAAARKIAQVFNCVDRSAQYINPTDAPHGDYGMIRPGDVLIIISKSGKTEEMTRMLPVARVRGAKIITVTETPQSKIAQESDVALILSTGPEACPYQCLSTTSVMAVFALFDAISIACMLYNGIDKEYFKTIHPAGGVGAMLKEEYEEK